MFNLQGPAADNNEMIVVAVLMLAATVWLVGVGNRAIEDLALMEGEIDG